MSRVFATRSAAAPGEAAKTLGNFNVLGEALAEARRSGGADGVARVEASFTIFCIAVTSASTSAFVLYIANEARVVAATFICAMTGMQQWCPVRTATPSRSRRVPRSIA